MTTTWISEIAAGLLPLLAFGRSLFTAPFGWSAATVRAFLLGAFSGCLFGLLAVFAMIYFLHQPPAPQIKRGYRRAPQPSRGPAHPGPRDAEALRDSLIQARAERDRAWHEKTCLEDKHREQGIRDKKKYFDALDAQAQEYQREISQLRRNQQRLQTESNAKSQQISQLQAQLRDAQQTAASAQAQLRQAKTLSDRTNAELERQQAHLKLEQEFKKRVAAAEARLKKEYQQQLQRREDEMRKELNQALAGANVATQQPRPRTGYIPPFTSNIKTIETSTFAASLPPVKKSEPEKSLIAPDQERQEATSPHVESPRHDHEEPSGGADEKPDDGDDSASESAKSSHLSDADEEADDEADDGAGDDDDSDGDDGGEGPGEGVSASPEVGPPSSPREAQQPAPVPAPSVLDEPVPVAPAPGPAAHVSAPSSPIPSSPAPHVPASPTSAPQSQDTEVEMGEADSAAQNQDGVQQASGFNNMVDDHVQPTHDIADTDMGEDFQPIEFQAASPGLSDQDTRVDASASQFEPQDDDMEDPPEMPPFSPLQSEDQGMEDAPRSAPAANTLSPVSDSQLDFINVPPRAPATNDIDMSEDNDQTIKFQQHQPTLEEQILNYMNDPEVGNPTGANLSTETPVKVGEGMFGTTSSEPNQDSATATDGSEAPQTHTQPLNFGFSSNTPVRFGGNPFGSNSQPNQDQDTAMNESEAPQSRNQPLSFGFSSSVPAFGQGTSGTPSQPPQTNPNLSSDSQKQSTRAVRDGIVANSQADAIAKRKAREAAKNKGKGKLPKDEDESWRDRMRSKEADKREENTKPLGDLFALDKMQAAQNHDHRAEEAAAREIVNKAEEEDAKAKSERLKKEIEAEREKKARQEDQESSESDADDDENVTIVTSNRNPTDEGDEEDWETVMNFRNPMHNYYRKPAATATPSPFTKPPTAPTPPPGYQAPRRAGNTGPDFSGGGYRVVSGGSGTYDPYATATRMYNQISTSQQAGGRQTQSNPTATAGNDADDDEDDEGLVEDNCRECGEFDNHHTRNCSVPKRR